jgi:hypothetical protein
LKIGKVWGKKQSDLPPRPLPRSEVGLLHAAPQLRENVRRRGCGLGGGGRGGEGGGLHGSEELCQLAEVAQHRPQSLRRHQKGHCNCTCCKSRVSVRVRVRVRVRIGVLVRVRVRFRISVKVGVRPVSANHLLCEEVGNILLTTGLEPLHLDI